MKTLIESRVKDICKRYIRQETPINSKRIFSLLQIISKVFYGVSNNISKNFLVIKFNDNKVPNIVFCYNRTSKEKFFHICQANTNGDSFPIDSLRNHIKALRAYDTQTFRAIAQSLKHADFTINLQHSV